jgi:tight adherence protein C
MLATLMALMAVACLAAAAAPAMTAPAGAELARLSTLSTAEITRRQARERPLWERLLRPWLDSVGPRVRPQWSGMSETDLRQAGLDPRDITLADVMALKLLGAVMGAAAVMAAGLLVPGALILLPGAAFAGFIAPSVVVARRRSARRARVLRELPDLVALMRAFVTTGVPLEQALHLISLQLGEETSGHLLAAEVRTALSDYGLGTSIDTALDALGERTAVTEVGILVAALSQGKRQGAGMERILRDQETLIRMQQRNRVVAEASRVGNRLVGVLVLVYLPEFILLIMVPLFYGIFLRAFG